MTPFYNVAEQFCLILSRSPKDYPCLVYETSIVIFAEDLQASPEKKTVLHILPVEMANTN